MRILVAGQEIDAWLLEGPYATTKLIFEIDGMLIFAEGNPGWFKKTAIPRLEALEKHE
jgi:hypothetical protein